MKKYFSKLKSKKGKEIEDSIMTVTENEETQWEFPFRKKHLSWLWFVVLTIFLIMIGRVFYLSVVRGSHFQEMAENNRIRNLVIKAPRGKIIDKFGNVLVSNIPSFDAILIPYDFPKDKNEQEQILGEISQILGLEKSNLEIMLSNIDENSLEPILIKENISKDQSLILAEKKNELPGIEIEKTAIRKYENSNIFAHVVGYDGKVTQKEFEENEGYLMTDYIGKTGLEKSYEAQLRGEHGMKQVEVDSLGNVKKELGTIDPVAGNELILNLDEGLQKKIFDSLTASLEKTETNTAAAVAIDPRNGGVLALVSLPSFDNNSFAQGISSEEYSKLVQNENLPLFNRAIKGEYPPGSTLKPSIAAAALSEGVVQEDTTVNCTGAIHVGSWSFGDWKTHGVTDIRKAIAESCDVFFYSVGGGYGNILGLGMDRMKKYDELFGFGEETGVDLLEEKKGLIPSPDWKEKVIGEKWSLGNSYHASIGQGYITATPLQLANYTAALANEGTLYEPRIVNRIKKTNGQEENIETKIIRKDFISEPVMKIVREGMRQTVENGTAQQLKDLPVQAAGKTGTAEFGVEKGSTHAWFIAFAPYENPEIAIAILAEGTSSGVSIPVSVTREALEWYFSR